MNKLPQETYDEIVSYFNGPSPRDRVYLPRLAGVSRRFQRSVERLTFRHLSVNLSRKELTNLELTMSKRRFGYLRTIHIAIVVEPNPQRARPPDHSNDEEVYVLIRGFLRLLGHQAGGVPTVSPLLDLKIDGLHQINDSAGLGHLHKIRAPIRSNPDDAGNLFSMLEPRRNWLLYGVSKFTFCNASCEGRYWSPANAVILTSRMAHAKEVHWELGCCHHSQDPSTRVDYYNSDWLYRDLLARELRHNILPSAVERFHCKITTQGNVAKFQKLISFLEPRNVDPVSLGLQWYTRNCPRVHLEGPFTPSLFHLQKDEAVGGRLSWQKLKKLDVILHMHLSPAGEWLFHTPSQWGENPDEEANPPRPQQTSTATPQAPSASRRPQHEKLKEVIIAFAHCCSRLASIKRTSLKVQYRDQVLCHLRVSKTDEYQAQTTGPHRHAPWNVILCMYKKPGKCVYQALIDIGKPADDRPAKFYFQRLPV